MKVMDVRYKEATLRQLANATARFNQSKGQAMMLDSKQIIKETLQKDKFERYPSYDKKGKLTVVGQAKRLTDLKNKGLDENATVGQYLAKSFDDLQKIIIKTIKKIKTNWKK